MILRSLINPHAHTVNKASVVTMGPMYNREYELVIITKRPPPKWRKGWLTTLRDERCVELGLRGRNGRLQWCTLPKIDEET
jgi:hypothetical protein